jgi:hypothetical protein
MPYLLADPAPKEKRKSQESDKFTVEVASSRFLKANIKRQDAASTFEIAHHTRLKIPQFPPQK